MSENLESMQEDLTVLLLDVLHAVSRADALPVWDRRPATPVVTSRVLIHDQEDESYLTVDVRLDRALAQLLAAQMMGVEDPSTDDVLDAVGELGNIVGGNVKSMLGQSARLSLPSAAVVDHLPEPDPEASAVAAVVHGLVIELILTPGSPGEDLFWPPASLEEALEAQP